MQIVVFDSKENLALFNAIVIKINKNKKNIRGLLILTCDIISYFQCKQCAIIASGYKYNNKTNTTTWFNCIRVVCVFSHDSAFIISATTFCNAFTASLNECSRYIVCSASIFGRVSLSIKQRYVSKSLSFSFHFFYVIHFWSKTLN